MGMRLTRRGRMVLIAGVALLALVLVAAIAALRPDVPGLTAPGDAAGGGTAGGGSTGEPAADAGPAARAGLKPSTRWRAATADQALAGEIAGYARPFIHPGDPLDLHVATSAPEFRVEAYRIGDYGGAGAGRVGRWGPFPGQRGAAPNTDPLTGAITADYPVAATLDTDGWEPGLYLVALWTVAEEGSGAGDGTAAAAPKRATVPVVVASPSAEGRVLLVAGDTTWQAYNTWGGASAYQGPDGSKATRSRAVSFARPYAWSGYRWPAAFDIPLVRAAEASGVPLAYASVTSLTADPSAAEGALGIVGNGHDEYWTAPYRQALARARDAGTNLAFLGANAGYWKTEMRDDGWTAWMPKEGTDQRWRDDPQVEPENAIVGQLYDCYPARADMVITDPGFFLFAGTGAARGTRLANLVGNESDRFYPLDSTPRPIQAPAVSPVSCAGAPTWSTVTYYTTDSGAGVLAVGTMDWVRAMGGPRRDQGLGDDSLAFTRTVTTNLLRAMADGPLGRSHPARDEFDDLDLPATITSRAVAPTVDNPELP